VPTRDVLEPPVVEELPTRFAAPLSSRLEVPLWLVPELRDGVAGASALGRRMVLESDPGEGDVEVWA
jgi:hypothetical protein